MPLLPTQSAHLLDARFLPLGLRQPVSGDLVVERDVQKLGWLALNPLLEVYRSW
jgi:hypothetical protein